MPTGHNNPKSIIIKIGTSLLSGQRAFEGHVMEAVVQELCALKLNDKLDILIVSSGAVGCGMRTLGLTKRPTILPQKQAVAAVGQTTLIHYYETLFATYGEGMHAAQVLLTLADLDNRDTYLNVRNTLQTLFEMKNIVPIINENDSTAHEELRFGDNDTLSARIAAKLDADMLIILTDVDGLFDKDPKEPGAKLIPQVAQITPELEEMAGDAGSIAGTGGMKTKLAAAKIAAASGVKVILANGHLKGVLHGVLDGSAPCTRFAVPPVTLSHRKRWIAFGRAAQGALTIDAGAENALLNKGKSLLAAGITGVEGHFGFGDAVTIRNSNKQDIARGLVNYGHEEINKIKGAKTSAIAEILGQKNYDEVVHRDNLVVL